MNNDGYPTQEQEDEIAKIEAMPFVKGLRAQLAEAQEAMLAEHQAAVDMFILKDEVSDELADANKEITRLRGAFKKSEAASALRIAELETAIVECRNVLVGGAERGGVFWREDAVEETKRIVPYMYGPLDA